ncbi:MAG: histidine ammonia-lyase [Bradymonadales bacterium]|nr:histidine ammonia-lyase [Bradymonadales bacterium]
MSPGGRQPPDRPSVTLDGSGLTLDQLVQIARNGAPVVLDPAALERVDRARDCVERRLATGEVYYGINTGFGYLAEVHIDGDRLQELQLNLIRSHACGVGKPLPKDVVRAVIALRIQTMLRGHSGVRRQTVELMAQLLNRGIYPVIPSQGSVGASGDLAPLAHLALALIGEGEVWVGVERKNSGEVFADEGLAPLVPAPKEGLSLINGTQVMTATGLLACHQADHLVRSADIIAAMTLDAVKGSPTPYRPEIQAARPHPGQIEVAANLMRLLSSDEIRESHAHCGKVQDPYSLRCVPQVHGAVRTALKHAQEVLLVEASSSTDNPLVFAESDEILSGGNFHGEPVALVLDYLAMAMSELGSISERRTDKLINPHTSGLPPFLARESGLCSGHMITQVVCASLASENKVLAHPASVDSIPTSADKEDHVSMGLTSATKLVTILGNVSRILAIEAIAAADGLEFHRPARGGVGAESGWRWVRSHCRPMLVDRSLAAEIETIAGRLLAGELVEWLNQEIGG